MAIGQAMYSQQQPSEGEAAPGAGPGAGPSAGSSGGDNVVDAEFTDTKPDDNK